MSDAPIAGSRLRESLPATPCLVRVRRAANAAGLLLWDGQRLLDLAGFRDGTFAKS